MVGRLTPVSVLAVLGLICAGCRPGPQDVSVDVVRAVLSAAPQPQLPTEPAANFAQAKSTEFNIPGSPEVTEGRSATIGAAKVKASIAANRDKTYRVIV